MCPKSRCILLLQILLMHLTMISFSHSVGRFTGNLTDMQSLLDIKAQITDDPLGVLSSWNQSLHFCQWSGVTCGRRHQRVVELDLGSSQLQGSLSPQVGNISFLRKLILENNSFTDHIPQELGRLFRLQNLVLRNNIFSGEIPVNISRCTNLREFISGSNNLTGKLPVELGTLSKLELFVFQKNNLVGEIPASFGNLSSITGIYGAINHLQGGIPASLGQLNKLSNISFDLNNLTGTVPPSIYNLSSLIILAVSGNQLHGTLPLNIGQILPQLTFLGVFSNRFSGEIPATLSNASHLIYLELSENNFTGRMPPMKDLHKLSRFSIYSNNLGKGEVDDLSFLYSLANNTSLEYLNIRDNNFGGELPEVISNFSTKLRMMSFRRNQIRGNIPREIGNLIGLQVVGFEENQLAGIIPASIGKLQKLHRFSIEGNKITGTIPSSLGNITSLAILDLSINKLQGRIPPSLGSFQKMLQLSLGNNELTGSIPEEVIGMSSLSISLDLSKNQLIGTLPLQVGKLVKLGILDISNNKLSGEIPPTFASCISLESLFLEGNSFQGTIPMPLSAIEAIQHLNFSNNNFTGKIPKFLGDFKLLESLDLSFNSLEGEVPVNGILENASRISITGNTNLCGGIPQLNLPKCSSLESTKPKSSTKRLLIVAIVCGCLGVIFMICFLLFCYFRKTRNKLPSGSSSLEMLILRVTYGDLHQATNGFSAPNLLGAGSFGCVYKGILNSNEMVVAVKVLNLLHKGALKSFIAECKAWTSIRHRNLLKVLTSCSSIDFQGNDFKAIVYEYMANGSLDEWLHPIHSPEDKSLNLLQRLNIAIDIASALDYLHHDCQMPVIHCDLKPSNVLLDADMTAHVGDFGLAKFLQEISDHSLQNQNNSIGLKGTIGYAAPEYGMGSEVSTYGDVYSFGILILEMLTGRRPTDDIFKDGMNLRNFAEAALPDCMLDVMDPILLNELQEASVAATSQTRSHFSAGKYMKCVSSAVRIGLSCSADFSKDRMDINTAAAELHRIRTSSAAIDSAIFSSQVLSKEDDLLNSEPDQPTCLDSGSAPFVI